MNIAPTDHECKSLEQHLGQKAKRPDRAGRNNYRITVTVDGSRQITVSGRQPCRTLAALIDAKEKGITALEISSWALRLGHYIWLLRHEYGLDIITTREPHDGGEHGRYTLLSSVALDEGSDA